METEEKRKAHIFKEVFCVCVYVVPNDLSPSARGLCLVLKKPPSRASALGTVILLLWSHRFLYSNTKHTHTNAHTHSTSCVSIYLDVIVWNIIKFCKYNLICGLFVIGLHFYWVYRNQKSNLLMEELVFKGALLNIPGFVASSQEQLKYQTQCCLWVPEMQSVWNINKGNNGYLVEIPFE